MRRPLHVMILAVILVTVTVTTALCVHRLGLSMYVITGSSMTGSIPKGSIMFDRLTPVEDLQVGDVITFVPPGLVDPVTHRIVDIEESSEGPVFKTKGDGNEAVDPWQFTLNSSLQAKYFFHIPYVGYALAAFTIRAVRVALLALLGLTILGVGISLLREPKPGPSSKSSMPRGEVVRL